MARQFTVASTEYLETDTAAIAGPPFTFAGWFYLDNTGGTTTLIFVGDKDAPNNFWSLGTNASEDVRFTARRGAATHLDTTTQAGGGAWHHACAVAVADDDRAVFLDAGGKATSTVSEAVVNEDRTSIGRLGSSSPSNYMDGRIAEAGIWNVALSDAEVALLANGVSPLFIQPQNLVSYWPLIRDDDQDRVGDLNMSAFFTPSVAVHPPKIIYPAPPQIWVVAEAVDGDLSVNVSDGLTVGEAVTVDPVSPHDISESDGLTVGETVSAELVHGISESDGITLGDTGTLDPVSTTDISEAESLTVGETVTLDPVFPHDINESDGLTIGEADTVEVTSDVGDNNVSESDGLTIGETVTIAPVFPHNVSVSEDLTVGETTTLSVAPLNVSEADGLTVGETTTLELADTNIAPSDGITIGDTATVAVIGAAPDNDISVSDGITLGEAVVVSGLLGGAGPPWKQKVIERGIEFPEKVVVGAIRSQKEQHAEKLRMEAEQEELQNLRGVAEARVVNRQNDQREYEAKREKARQSSLINLEIAAMAREKEQARKDAINKKRRKSLQKARRAKKRKAKAKKK